MNKKILNTDVQDFIRKNLNVDIVSILLKKPLFEGITQQELAQQLESKKKCQKKLPTWFETPGIYYPNKINIEQTSSEITAEYKSKIVDGKSLLDITGGLGIDSYYFSKKISSVHYCELDEKLTEIASHNLKILDVKNIKIHSDEGLGFLRNTNKDFHWIYLDPSRRSRKKGKVFQLSDCFPNVPENLEFLFSKSKNILVKTSPLLDISKGLTELRGVREIHSVAVANEVKELLWVLEKGFNGETEMRTINFTNSEKQVFNFSLSEEKRTISEFDYPKSYIYEPNAAILKSGAFKSLGAKLKVKKLHQHTHLYTSNNLIDFPGRRFKVLKIANYNSKGIETLGIKKANLTTRNFSDSVVTIRRKFKIKDGGSSFLFFFTNIDNIYQVASCQKI